LSKRVVIFNHMGLLKGQQLFLLKAKNTNVLKCLFEICDPTHSERKAIEFGDTIVLKNLWDGQYLKANQNKLAEKCFGC
jgi:hypothetical protein